MKIFLIPHPANFNVLYSCPRGEHIVIQGLIENNIELVNSYEDADFAILDYVPHDGENKFVYGYIDQYADKLVCIDWMDEPDKFIYEPARCKAYFKRSMCIPENDPNSGLLSTFKRYISHVGITPFAYCSLPDFDLGDSLKLFDRPIILGCFLRPSCSNRIWTLEVVKEIANKLGVSNYVGEVNSSSRSVGTKCHYDNEYLQYLANTKIIVTCEPQGWTGDSRLWESLSSGALVVSDQIFAEYENKPMNEKHLLEYHIGSEEDLFSRIRWAVQNLGESQEIADAGKKWTLEHHTPKARMKVVIDHLRGLL